MRDDDGADLTLLIETNDQVELAGVRGLLDGHDIKYVVQGELHSAMIGGLLGNPAITPRVLVSKRDLERAVELLAATPDTETQPHEAGALEAAECPVHLKAALATCGRCGTFLCSDCKALGAPPLCEECNVAEEWQRKPKDLAATRFKKAVLCVLLAPYLIMIAAELFTLIGDALR